MENLKNEMLKIAHLFLYENQIVHDYSNGRLSISRDSIVNNKKYAMMNEDAAYRELTIVLSSLISKSGEYRFTRIRHNDDFIFMDIIGKGI